MNLQDTWYGRAGWWLLPLSWAMSGAVHLRRRAYASGWCKRLTLPVPVIVVGNITAGGTGKTPVVAWLARSLAAAGWRPGIVSRGYGRAARGRVRVHPGSTPREVGDEPILLARRTGLPVCVARDRVAAARYLLEMDGVDVIIADDGLQHYRLARDVEIAVIDAVRGFGNGHLLPAGSLREPPARLREVDLVLANGGPWEDAVSFTLRAGEATRLSDGARCPLASFRGQRVHAVAGIGHPRRFFDMLRAAGIEPVEHAFADHHAYRPGDLEFADDDPVLMTEKDAVKCEGIADARAWQVPVEVSLDARVFRHIESMLAVRTG